MYITSSFLEYSEPILKKKQKKKTACVTLQFGIALKEKENNMINVAFISISGLRLPQCHSNYIDIDMSWPSHEIICEGAATNETVVWFLYRETRNTNNVTCPLSQPCCCNNWFNGTRNGTHSFLNNSKSYENRTWYSEFFISCLINGSNDTTPTCRIDIIRK